MSDETRIDPSLSPETEQRIQNRWLGLTQAEFGALQTNFFMMQARVEALMEQRALDLNLIAGFRSRAFTAEENLRLLQDQYRDLQEKLRVQTERTSVKARLKEPNSRKRALHTQG